MGMTSGSPRDVGRAGNLQGATLDRCSLSSEQHCMGRDRFSACHPDEGYPQYHSEPRRGQSVPVMVPKASSLPHAGRGHAHTDITCVPTWPFRTPTPVAQHALLCSQAHLSALLPLMSGLVGAHQARCGGTPRSAGWRSGDLRR
jgi:hypothetical protein